MGKATDWLKLYQLLCVYLQNIITQARKTGEQVVSTHKKNATSALSKKSVR